MPSCRVNECSNRSGGGVRLFSIPKRSRDVDIAKKWLKSVWDKELDDEQFTLLMKEEFRVCAEHFVDSDFDARGKLKADAVPSRFPWNGGQQRVITPRSKTNSVDHKSNGVLVSKLTRALRAAESIVDGEIKDIDKWVLQLQTQVDHLRTKREKLIQHKAELSRSLSEFAKAESAISSSTKGQSSNSNPINFITNGTNYFLSANNSPGESLSASFAESVEQNNNDNIHSHHKRHGAADEMELYSLTSDGAGVGGFLSPLVTSSVDTTEPVALNAEPLAETAAGRRFATRRKNLRPTRVSVGSRVSSSIEANDGDLSATNTAADDDKDPLPSSSNTDGGMDCEPSAGQCDF